MPAPRLSVVCAWCNRVVARAPLGAAVTHTICPACVDWAVTNPASHPAESLSDDRHLASDLYELRDPND
jgi:hypothetical protein